MPSDARASAGSLPGTAKPGRIRSVNNHTGYQDAEEHDQHHIRDITHPAAAQKIGTGHEREKAAKKTTRMVDTRCHKKLQVGQISAERRAGGSKGLQWEAWVPGWRRFPVPSSGDIVTKVCAGKTPKIGARSEEELPARISGCNSSQTLCGVPIEDSRERESGTIVIKRRIQDAWRDCVALTISHDGLFCLFAGQTKGRHDAQDRDSYGVAGVGRFADSGTTEGGFEVVCPEGRTHV